MLLEYLKKVFGKSVINEYNPNVSNLPFYLSNEYCFYGILINAKKYVFVKTKGNLNLKSYKVQQKKLQDLLALPVVLCADKLSFQQRENLIQSGLEFVEPEKQLFMPSVGTILDSKCKNLSDAAIEKFTPQTQLCALFFFYGQKKEYSANEISETTGLNVMAVSRGVTVLTSFNLLSVRKAARTNYYTVKVNKIEYISIIKTYLVSPVAKYVYANEETIINLGVKAGYTALEQFTSILDSDVKTYAISKTTYKSIESRCFQSVDNLISSDKPIKLEVWKYDPMIFMNNGCADKLSLYLSFEKDIDERTEEALNELMKEIKND